MLPPLVGRELGARWSPPLSAIWSSDGIIFLTPCSFSTTPTLSSVYVVTLSEGLVLAVTACRLDLRTLRITSCRG